MELILCNTNLSVTSVVSLVLSNKLENFIVLTDQPNIESFFQLLSFSNVSLQYLPSEYRFFDKGIYKAKSWIKDLFIKNQITKVRMFHQAYGGFYNWIVYYSNKRNVTVEYNRVLRDQQYPRAKTSLYVIKERLRYNILFKADVDVLDRGNRLLMPKLSKKFYEKYNICEVKFDVDAEIINKVANTIMNRLGLHFEQSLVVLLTGSILKTMQVDYDEYNIKTKKLIEFIGRKNIVCKCHPRFTDELEEEKKLPHIPSYVPMEFLIPYFDVFIGYNSTVLVQASHLGKKSISLLDYYRPISEDRRNKWYPYFRDAKIFFIKDVDELTGIIK